MTTTEIAQLEQQEKELTLPAFGAADAWRLGSWLAGEALRRKHPLVIDIRRPNLVLFRCALPGATPDQEEWAERKAALVLRMETSSRLFASRMASRKVDPTAIGWLDHRYAITGGSVPIRVAGIGVVAAVTASGLTSADDHDFVVEGIIHLLRGRGTVRDPSSPTPFTPTSEESA